MNGFTLNLKQGFHRDSLGSREGLSLRAFLFGLEYGVHFKFPESSIYIDSYGNWAIRFLRLAIRWYDSYTTYREGIVLEKRD